MNEQLLKMNGLSVEILDTLSFESHLGIPLKNNLHYFDKDLLIAELVAMTEWLDEQEILSGIALDYRVKSLDSILLKYDRYYPDHQTRKVFNDILGFRAFCDSYDQILEEENIREIKSYIHAPGYIANTDLAALYCGAFAFLYPSLRESFGIPMLEAMACGTPIIAGNTSAMPEIAGEGALLADPFNSNDITEKILQLENDQTLYQQQVEYGIQRSQLFSWRNTAESLLKIYKEFAK